jgi:hypothetical protein
MKFMDDPSTIKDKANSGRKGEGRDNEDNSSTINREIERQNVMTRDRVTSIERQSMTMCT